MSRWTHSICQACWNQINPDQEAVTVREEYRDESLEICCYCGFEHGSGIYIREDPLLLRCQGEHHDPAERPAS